MYQMHSESEFQIGETVAFKSVSETFVCGSDIHVSLICNKYSNVFVTHGFEEGAIGHYRKFLR